MNKDIMLCPDCGRKLKAGYIFSPRKICWSESPDSIVMDFGSEVLVESALLKVRKIPAHRCEVCQKVIFGYEQ
ncbi:PF20097 family protein [Halobacillus kuroshimensis]|uniref:PF20097 family protein n=1 Tax=Halobacillus kuroshimensis TaxID=302481 RepID=UPI0030F57122